jgi:hypothetical protein
VHAVVRDIGEFRGIDRVSRRRDCRMQVATGIAGREFGVLVMGNCFGIEYVETRCGARYVGPLAVIRDRDRVQLVLLGLVEVAGAAPKVLVDG